MRGHSFFVSVAGNVKLGMGWRNPSNDQQSGNSGASGSLARETSVERQARKDCEAHDTRDDRASARISVNAIF